MCGLLNAAKDRGWEVGVYLQGDGVYCAKKGQKGSLGVGLRNALQRKAEVYANRKDLLARAIPETNVEPGVKVLDGLEGQFVEDVMERSERTISW